MSDLERLPDSSPSGPPVIPDYIVRSRLPTPSRSTSLASEPPGDASKTDEIAISDVYRQVDVTGSLEAAAVRLSRAAKHVQMWEDDPEEAGYLYAESDDDDSLEEEDLVVEHLCEVVDGLWVGDLVAAMDTSGLEERNIVGQRLHRKGSMLRRRPTSCLCSDRA